MSNKKKEPNDTDKYCLIHGWGGHSSNECFRLKEEAKRIKTGSNDSSNNSRQKKGNHKNKSWHRQANDNKTSTKKDLAVIVKNAVEKGVKKELAAISKKRKSQEEEININAIDLDLKDFNYEDMENLKIDEPEEG